MTGRRKVRSDEGGFSLIELLAVIGILGVISFVLTEAVIVGFKTTDATTDDISRSSTVQALQSYFTGDAQSAKQVSTTFQGCGPTPSEVFLHLSWTDRGSPRNIAYALEADASDPGQHDLVRLSCAPGGTDRRMLGRFSFDQASPVPQLAVCEPACTATPSAPVSVTLRIPTNRPQEASPSAPLPAVDLTVVRRAA